MESVSKLKGADDKYKKLYAAGGFSFTINPLLLTADESFTMLSNDLHGNSWEGADIIQMKTSVRSLAGDPLRAVENCKTGDGVCDMVRNMTCDNMSESGVSLP